MFNNNLLRKKHRSLTLHMTVNVSVKQKHPFMKNPLIIASKENLYEEIKILPKIKFIRVNSSRYVGNPQPKKKAGIYYVRSRRAKIVFSNKCVLTP